SDRESHQFVLLAVDETHKLVGADYQARRLLTARNMEFGHRLTLSRFFQLDALPLVQQRHRDVTVKLPGSEDGATWSIVITPPHAGASQLIHDERVLLHARPRLDSLGPASRQPREHEVHGGLRPGMLRRVEQYIDAHLASPLKVDALASCL